MHIINKNVGGKPYLYLAWNERLDGRRVKRYKYLAKSPSAALRRLESMDIPDAEKVKLAASLNDKQRNLRSVDKKVFVICPDQDQGYNAMTLKVFSTWEGVLAWAVSNEYKLHSNTDESGWEMYDPHDSAIRRKWVFTKTGEDEGLAENWMYVEETEFEK